MSGLFGKPVSNSNVEPKLASLQYQTSAYGAVVPVCYGSVRIPANLLWFANFTAIPHTESQTVGKGGGGGSTQSNTTWTYTADVILGLCEGPIASIYYLWRDKDMIGWDSPAWCYTNFLGAPSQSPWGQVTVDGLPDQALGYGGIAYLAAASLDLGGSGTVKNHNVNVFAAPSTWATGAQQGWWLGSNPVKIAQDAMTNTNYGMGWTAGLLDGTTWTNAAQYCLVNYLHMAAAYTQAQAAISHLEDMFSFANCMPVWSAGKLKLIPLADQPVSSGLGSWTPNSTPLYALTNDDFIVTSSDQDPVKVTVRPLADSFNQLKVQFSNPLIEFADDTVTVEDLGDIDRFGLRAGSEVRLGVTTPEIARRVGQLALQRSLHIRRTFEFRLGWRYALLEPMDLVTITDTTLGLAGETVRIMAVDEDPENDEFVLTAEEWPFGVATAVAYQNPGGSGGGLNSTTPPGAVAADPVIWEPPGDLTNWLPELWVAVYGEGAAWGGCDVWASRDGLSYTRISRVTSKARVGYVTTISTAAASGGGVTDPTWDPNTRITIDFTRSKGQLISVGQADCDRFGTLSLLRHSVRSRAGTWAYEYLSYKEVTLVGGNQYEMINGMHRGLFGTAGNTSHPSGSTFVRLDENILKLDASRWNVGEPIYLKFQSFNVWGQMSEDLSTCRAYAYTILGTARSGSPITNVTMTISATVP